MNSYKLFPKAFILALYLSSIKYSKNLVIFKLNKFLKSSVKKYKKLYIPFSL